eukprot:maker-scaffold1367_size45391-snap-gene-0.7 protein:Tk10938 transcript:maker-scaffold1367_size45391-snap-gene-0.7-mRNA-1 annotation:"serine proteinase stubble-like"
MVFRSKGRHQLWVLTVFCLSPMATLGLDAPDHEKNSRQLTKTLLDLDLGYNVLNQEAMRRSIGFNVDTIDRTDDQGMAYDYVEAAEFDEADKSSDRVSFFKSESEVLPAPLSLVREDNFFSGPNPEGFWLDSNFWGSNAWGPFGGRPQRNPPSPPKARRQLGPPKKKMFDNAHRPELDFGSVQNDPRCGLSASRRNVAQRRIVGGDEAGFGSFPWQAYIRIGTSRCGGSLINEWYVVTAGHCVARARASQVRVTLGEYVLKSSAEPLPGRTYGASVIKVHPYFKFTPQADRYDVAVVRLNRRVELAPHISPICLPPKDMEMDDMHGWAAGWGALQPGSRLRPKTLQVVDVPLIQNRECESWHKDKGINVIIYDEMICAGYYGGGKDSCQGDSGGPLMAEIEGRWTLIGIVSAGYSCAKSGQPGIYHRVSRTSDWISYSINT